MFLLTFVVFTKLIHKVRWLGARMANFDIIRHQMHNWEWNFTKKKKLGPKLMFPLILSFIPSSFFPKHFHCCYIYFHCSYLYNYYNYKFSNLMHYILNFNISYRYLLFPHFVDTIERGDKGTKYKQIFFHPFFLLMKKKIQEKAWTLDRWVARRILIAKLVFFLWK
jgi:hypothetical protein